jgi:hypothetical protein
MTKPKLVIAVFFSLTVGTCIYLFLERKVRMEEAQALPIYAATPLPKPLSQEEVNLNQFLEGITSLSSELGTPINESTGKLIHGKAITPTKKIEFEGAWFEFFKPGKDYELYDFEIKGASIPLPFGIEIGLTKKQDIKQLFGTPDNEATSPDTITYRNILMWFDNGVLQAIQHSGNWTTGA